MVESSSISITPSEHAANHVIGGTDPLIQPLLLHASRHAPGGADEVAIFTDHAHASLYDATPTANTWTDLDLSGAVGAAVHLVVVRFWREHEANFYIRQKGDTDEYAASGMQGATTTNKYVTMMCLTDASGVIQFKTDHANPVLADLVFSI